MRLSEFLLKYRSLVIALAVVTSLGVGLVVMHLKPINKKPPRPSPGPPPAVEVGIHRQPKSAVVSPPDNRQPKLESASPPPLPKREEVSPRPRAFRTVNTPVEPAQISTGKVVPVVIKRSRSVVAITRGDKVEQRGGSGTHIQAGQNRLEPPEDRAAAPDAVVPFFAPPAPPEGGINALIEDTPQSNMKEALVGYIRTYYPLMTLDAESIKLLNVQGKAEYARQKAALDKELSDSIRGSIFPTPGDIPNTLPQELIDTLRTEDLIENN